MFVLVLSVTVVRDWISSVALRLAVKIRVKLQGDILGMTSINCKDRLELKELQNIEGRRKEDWSIDFHIVGILASCFVECPEHLPTWHWRSGLKVWPRAKPRPNPFRNQTVVHVGLMCECVWKKEWRHEITMGDEKAHTLQWTVMECNREQLHFWEQSLTDSICLGFFLCAVGPGAF